jgi:hypothetical protein
VILWRVWKCAYVAFPSICDLSCLINGRVYLWLVAFSPSMLRSFLHHGLISGNSVEWGMRSMCTCCYGTLLSSETAEGLTNFLETLPGHFRGKASVICLTSHESQFYCKVNPCAFNVCSGGDGSGQMFSQECKLELKHCQCFTRMMGAGVDRRFQSCEAHAHPWKF